MKRIHIFYVNRIKEAKKAAFDSMDNAADVVDGAVAEAREKRKIERLLDQAGIADPKDHRQVLGIVNWYDRHCVDRLEKSGWEVVRGRENL